jgi:hypothetical protein
MNGVGGVVGRLGPLGGRRGNNCGILLKKMGNVRRKRRRKRNGRSRNGWGQGRSGGKGRRKRGGRGRKTYTA